MLWNTAIEQALINTCLVSGGATCVGVGLGWLLAVLVTCLRIPFARAFTFLMLGMALVPVYVQATAWSAGFGVQGWLRFSQVAAAISPAFAMLSVIWVHGVAAAPICFLIGKIGLTRSMDNSARQAILDFGAWFALRRVLIWNAWPWGAASILWTIAMTSNDMVVTNLYQVPTLTEAIYQQVQFNEVRTPSILVNGSFAFMIALIAATGFMLVYRRMGAENLDAAQAWQALLFSKSIRWVGACIAFGVVLVVAIIPLFNLWMRSGWNTHVVNGQLQSNWSRSGFQQALIQIQGFSTEFTWSIQLGVCASLLAIVLASLLIWGLHMCCWQMASTNENLFNSSIHATTIGLMVFLLALPGPLVNLFVLKLFTVSNAAWLGYIADRTLTCPIMALQCRCLPIAFGILWIAKERFYRRHELELRMDAGLPRAVQVWVWATGMSMPALFAMTICFMIAFAELATYLLVLPPGVTTVAMRMFDLLHYGVNNQEAALAIVLVLISFVIIGALVFAENKARRA